MNFARCTLYITFDQYFVLKMSHLYLHIPFCKQRCIYCDFYFVTTHRSTWPFVEALTHEIAEKGAIYGELEPIDSIYFGGGTPSQLPIDEVKHILDSLDVCFDTSEVLEVTFEINPDDANASYLNELRGAGINRLSIGVQSFSEPDLQWMHRAHTQEQAMNVFDLAREAGFINFSMDLIFGLPSQTLAGWQDTLRMVEAIKPPHISTYSLTVEPGTILHKRINNKTEKAPTEDVLAALYREAIRELSKQGYEHYEVSSFALDGFRAQHNQAYWTHKNYLGLGPSAHSFWKNDSVQAERWKNVSNLKEYIQRIQSDSPPHSETEIVSKDKLLDEYIMLRMRTLDGLSLDGIKKTYNVDFFEKKKDTLERLMGAGLVAISSTNHVHLTPEGFLVCDAIVSELLV